MQIALAFDISNDRCWSPPSFGAHAGQATEILMSNFILVVEDFLNGLAIAHHRDDRDALVFDLPFGRTAYTCIVRQVGEILILTSQWHGSIPAEHLDHAERIIRELINAAGAHSGKTLLNRREGLLQNVTSVDLSMVSFDIKKVRKVLETLLDPFNVMILAMQMTLENRLTQEAAVECLVAWDRDRVASSMAEADPIDPTLN